MTEKELIPLPETNEELLSQCRVETFRSGGKGGQHANKTESAVRLTHNPSDIRVSCQDERSQYQNKIKCLKELRKRIEKYNFQPPKRIPTKSPKSADEKRLTQKKIHSQKKKIRRKPEIEE